MVEHSPVDWFLEGVWPSCSCGFAPKDNRTLIAHWAENGVEWVDDHGTLQMRTLAVDPVDNLVATLRAELYSLTEAEADYQALGDDPEVSDYENYEDSQLQTLANLIGPLTELLDTLRPR